METSYNVIYKDFVTIREVSKKLARVPKTVCYSSRKSHETNVSAKKIWTRLAQRPTLVCYPLNYGRYMEKGPLEWRNVSFWLLFEQIIFC
jgi:hypothetical protein